MTRTPHSWLLLEIIVYDGFPETYSQSKMPPPPTVLLFCGQRCSNRFLVFIIDEVGSLICRKS